MIQHKKSPAWQGGRTGHRPSGKKSTPSTVSFNGGDLKIFKIYFEQFIKPHISSGNSPLYIYGRGKYASIAVGVENFKTHQPIFLGLPQSGKLKSSSDRVTIKTCAINFFAAMPNKPAGNGTAEVRLVFSGDKITVDKQELSSKQCNATLPDLGSFPPFGDDHETWYGDDGDCHLCLMSCPGLMLRTTLHSPCSQGEIRKLRSAFDPRYIEYNEGRRKKHAQRQNRLSSEDKGSQENSVSPTAVPAEDASAAEWGAWFYSRGFNVLPIIPGKKSPPIKYKKWRTKRQTEKEVASFWENRPNHGAAIMCGNVSKNLVVLDFDEMSHEDLIAVCDALEIKPLWTVATARGYHIWMMADGLPDNFKIQDFTDLKLGSDESHIEYRANDHLAMAPPSLHPEGHQYRFFAPPDGEPQRVPHDRIIQALSSFQTGKAVKSVASSTHGATADRSVFGQCSGDLHTLDIIELFRSRDLYLSEIEDGKHSVMCPWNKEHSTGDPNTDTSTVVYEAADGRWPAFNCLHAHCLQRKLPALIEFFGPESIDQFCSEKYSVPAQVAGIKVSDEELEIVDDKAVTPQINLDTAMPERGYIFEYVQACEPLTEAPPVFHLATAITMIAGTVGRQIFMPRGVHALFPNEYVLLIAPSGMMRKTTAVFCGSNIISKVFPERIFPAQFSRESLSEVLSEGPKIGFVGEYMTLLATTKQSHANGVIADLTSIWDAPESIVIAFKNLKKNKSDKVTKHIDKPTLSIIGATTIEYFQVSRSDISGGFLGRHLIVLGTEEGRIIPIPPAMPTDQRERLRQGIGHFDNLINGEMRLSDDALKFYVEEYTTDRHKYQESTSKSDAYGSFLSRKPDHWLKIAMVYEISQRRESRTINLDSLQRAVAFVDYCDGSYKHLLGQIATDAFQEIRRDVLNFIRMNRAGVTMRKIYRQFRLTRYDADNVVDSLTYAGEVRWIETSDQPEGPGRPKSPVLVAIKTDGDD